MADAGDTLGMFDTVLGLPLHPLIVHGVVVLIPLTVIAIAVGVIRPAWGRPASSLAAIAALLSAVFAFTATQSGEALAARVGSPGAHQQWGDRVLLASLALLAVTAAWWWSTLRGRATAAHHRPSRALGWGALAVGVVAIVLTVAAGHSGATVTWQGRLAALEAPAVAVTEAGITIEQVRAAAAAGSCWVVIDGAVYDLTAWVADHPGGPLSIEALCGTDGTDAFTTQHGGQDAPTQVLTGYRIGDLVAG